MALNENLKGLIKSVADNDMQKSKAYAKIIIDNETAEKNKHFCQRIKNQLEVKSAFIEVPPNLQGKLIMEDVSLSFNPNRYYLTEREKSVFREIEAVKITNDKLAQMKIKHLNATLLYGESGTGKTTFGRYVAHQLNLPFAYVNFAQCIDSLLGSTGKNIEKIFAYLSTQKCVLMLDEVDAVGMARGKEDVGEMARVVIGIIHSLDKIENDVVVIAATNRYDMIDNALIRRFSVRHEVKTLTEKEVIEMVEKFIRDVGVECKESDILTYAVKRNRQSDIVNDIVKSIIVMLKTGDNFKLQTNCWHQQNDN